MSLKQRIFYFDELRMIAILAVILCHVSNFYPHVATSFKAAIPYFLLALGRIGVPLFLMLSGALLLNRDYELSFFLKKRFSRILIPFIFWVIFIGFYQFYILNFTSVDTVKWMLGGGITWYVYELIGAYFFIPVVNAFIKQYGDTGVKYFLILWIVTVILKTFNLNPISHLNLENFTGFIGYMVMGYYLSNKKFNLKDNTMIFIGILLFVVFYIVHCASCLYYDNLFDYVSLNLLIQSAGIFLAFRYLSEYKKNNENSSIAKIGNKKENGIIGKIVLSISICSYGMYFTHTIVYRTFDYLFNFPTLKLLPIAFIAIVILSWAITYVCSKIPVISKVSGVK